MFLKINCLDLRPKPVDDDPLRLKSLLQHKAPRGDYRTVEERPKKLPMRLESASAYRRPANPGSRAFHLALQREAKVLEKGGKLGAKDQPQFQSALKAKVYLEGDAPQQRKSAAVNRQQGGYWRYKELFVEPKVKAYNDFKESISKIKVDASSGGGPATKENGQYNPQFIVKAKEKPPRLMSAFTVLNEPPKEGESTHSKLEEKLASEKKTFVHLNAMAQLKEENPGAEGRRRPETCAADPIGRKRPPKFRLMSVKPLADPGLKAATRLRSAFSKPSSGTGHGPGLLVDGDKGYYNKVIKLEIGNLDIFNADFDELGSAVNLNQTRATLQKYMRYTAEYETRDKYQRALHYLKKIYHSRVFEQLGSLRAYTYNHMSYCYFELKNYNAALELSKAYMEATEGAKRLVGLYNATVCCRVLRNQAHEAFYCQLYRSEAKKVGDKAHMFFSAIQMVLCRLGAHQKAEAQLVMEVS